ncbi:metallophosphoesterase [Kitasatospora phosalacinea]|uniref:Metallophosphoesterase n=1 Tax=Kitasatospora phosalacinea TaxID=2065 RepID=A0A9W6V4C8_9ACTN|nr:metallophosphoesterase [Kitasatospora phosalacinea]GLW72092.1 metallophosphoesterase [Kitasatospora phosalacinea]
MTGHLADGHPRIWAVSDLHVAHPANRAVVDRLRPAHPGDWLLVAGDVGELYADVTAALDLLAARFAKVVWTPGNHELWTHPHDPVTLRGEHRYHRLVEHCRSRGIATPEDPYPVWTGPGGPVVVAPLFVLYDYTFRPPGTRTAAEALAVAEAAGIVCTDQFLLHPDPYPSREDWCRARVARTEERLAALPADLPTVLVNHYPLVREPTEVLRHPEFAQWCGTEATADWHRRHRAVDAVYGHLHIPRRTVYDGVRFTEVSLGYPRERSHRPPAEPLQQIVPAPVPTWGGRL